MTKTDIINYFVSNYRYNTYLEIGLDTGKEYQAIQCPIKESVDPFIIEDHNQFDLHIQQDLPDEIKKLLTYRMTSDEFFAQNEKKYDIILIDGLHEQQQVIRDILNSLESLTDNGVIIVHDCLPVSEMMQRIPRETGSWTGDVWKGVAELIRHGLVMHTVNTDYGVGIIRKKDNSKKIRKPVKPSEFTWTDFQNNKNKLLNVISVEEFYERY